MGDQGQGRESTLPDSERWRVVIYRGTLLVSALSFGLGVWLVLGWGKAVLPWLTPLYSLFCLALGMSLLTITILITALLRGFQLFWLIGVLASLFVGYRFPAPLAQTVYEQPLALFGVGFTFAALMGISFREAYCFARLESLLLTVIIPILLLGRMTQILPLAAQQVLLVAWAVLFLILTLRKITQPIPPELGDFSIFRTL